VELNTHSEIVLKHLDDDIEVVIEWITYAVNHGDPIRDSLTSDIEHWIGEIAEPEGSITNRVIPDIVESLFFQYEAIADRLMANPKVATLIEEKRQEALKTLSSLL